jgi:hypothetical protein
MGELPGRIDTPGMEAYGQGYRHRVEGTPGQKYCLGFIYYPVLLLTSYSLPSRGTLGGGLTRLESDTCMQDSQTKGVKGNFS